jgi:hypothetical protein
VSDNIDYGKSAVVKRLCLTGLTAGYRAKNFIAPAATTIKAAIAPILSVRRFSSLSISFLSSAFDPHFGLQFSFTDCNSALVQVAH